jgi:hypothetical protein
LKQTRVLHLEKEPRVHLPHGWKIASRVYPQTVIKERQDPENIIIIPPFFHINSCTMENNNNILPPLTVEEIRNMDLSDVNPNPTKLYDELNCVLGEAC